METAFTKFTKRFITRHPLLYYVRFLLLSRNLGSDNLEEVGRYDLTNKIEDVPQIFFDTNIEIGINTQDSSVEKAIKIARFLKKTSEVGPAISLSSRRTLETILAGKGGVCNDFSMVFNVFCLINGISSKEWNCVERFYDVDYGHTFNEIYSEEHQKWIAIDISKMIFFTAKDSNTPLSAIELFNGLRNNEFITFDSFSNNKLLEVDRLKSVFSKNAIPYITCNYRAAECDHYLEKFQIFPLFVIGAITVLLRKHYSFVFVIDDYKQKLFTQQSTSE